MSDQNPKLEKGELNVKIVASIVIGVIMFVAWFYNSVIIPINQLQVSVAQIQTTLSEQTITAKTLDGRLNVVENKVDKLIKP